MEDGKQMNKDNSLTRPWKPDSKSTLGKTESQPNLHWRIISPHYRKFLITMLCMLEDEVPSFLFGIPTSTWPNTHLPLTYSETFLSVRYVLDTVEGIRDTIISQKLHISLFSWSLSTNGKTNINQKILNKI